MARYKPVEWGPIAVLMRESSFRVLEALKSGPKGWTELKTAASLTDGGLQKVLKQLVEMRLVEEKLLAKKTGLKEKKYCLSKKAADERIFEKALSLKNSLLKVAGQK